MLSTFRADARDLPIDRVLFDAASFLRFVPKLSVVLETFHDHSVPLQNSLRYISACFTFPWLSIPVPRISEALHSD